MWTFNLIDESNGLSLAQVECTNKKLVLLEDFFSSIMLNSFFLFLFFKKNSILDDVSFESFLIRRLHVKGPYKPFLLQLMRNKIAPEEKR